MQIDVHIKIDKSALYLVVVIIAIVSIVFLTAKNPAIAPTIAEFLDITSSSLDIIEFINNISSRH